MTCKWAESDNIVKWPIKSEISGFKDSDLLCNELLGKESSGKWGWKEWELTEPQVKILVEKMTRGFSPTYVMSLKFANEIPAGITYLGQMLTHEIVPNSDSSNQRDNQNPELNLESIYFDESDPIKKSAMEGAKFKLANDNDCLCTDRVGFDLERGDNGVALIPEVRNDENVITAQLHGVWLKLHNDAVDYQKKHSYFVNEPFDAGTAYSRAKSFVTLLFQKVIVEEFLKYTIHPRVFDLYFVQKNEFIYKHSEADKFELPKEFSHAVFRFGHSLVRQIYRLKKNEEETTLIGELFNRQGAISDDLFIDWEVFFPFPRSNVDHQHASANNLIIASGLTEILDKITMESLKENSGPLMEAFELARVREFMGTDVGNLKDSDFQSFIKLRDRDTNDSARQENVDDSDHPQLGEKEISNIIVKDLIASSKVPSGVDVIELISSKSSKLYQLLRLPKKNDLIDRLSPSSPNAGNIMIGLNLPSKKPLPLWIFSLHEATIFPYTDKIASSTGLPVADEDRLGAISSVVVAETISMSIRKSKTNIYQNWDSGSECIAAKLGALARVYSRICIESEPLTMSAIIDKKFFKY